MDDVILANFGEGGSTNSGQTPVCGIEPAIVPNDFQDPGETPTA